MVSLSPTEDSSADDVLRYDAGWAATNKLVRAGHSFSGRERHCAFLNLGSQRFANVSSATNLDLIDDGRGMALCDWDWDGKVDFWLTSRTGPRVRFLHNQFASDNNFIAIRLKGIRANRDAIGARVEIRTTEHDAPIIRTVYCGSGFLSQSSKWLHFGIGDAENAGVARVHWPGGDTEIWTGLKANAFYLLEEGLSEAVVLSPSHGIREIRPSKLEAPESRGAARVVLLNPAPIPEIAYTSADGSPETLDSHRGRPLLAHLWATWCANCRGEMTGWAAERARFESSGLRVLSLCVDEPGESAAEDIAKALAAARQMDYTMPIGLVRGDPLETLNVMQKAFIGRQTDLPLPSSFLIDARGRLAVIYKGPVSASQILADLALLEAPSAEIVAAAAPSAGRWLEAPRGGEPRGIAVSLVEHGMPAAAANYLDRLIPLLEEPRPHATDAEETTRISELAECHIFLGALAFDEERFEDSAAHLRRSLEIDPRITRARDELVRALLKLDRKAEALAEARLLLEAQPTPDRKRIAARLFHDLGQMQEAIEMFEGVVAEHPSAEGEFELANALRDAGRARDAIRHYRSALEQRPGWVLPANNLAWVLATHSDPELRNGVEAVGLALAACAATDNKVPQFSGTLAAAYAETGDFAKAAEVATQGIDLARQLGDTELAAGLIEKRALYQSGSAFRERER
ncbi:MAG TPA: ASPIC/UnbV domain-containing protein [Verrucomicrobiales bacterium]|nr:ASPIC/UnbV domain-containing protein [Verrucomicrobiales bacterium]